MKSFRRHWGLVAALLALACERANTRARSDSATTRPAMPTDSAAAAASPGGKWDAAAGPVLLVASASPAQAFVVAPDSTTAAAELAAIPHPASVTLFGRGGTVQTADLPAVQDTGGCTTGTLSAAPPPRAWSVGFIGGVVAPLPLDSTEAIAPADSAALVIVLNRLASALPNDSAGRFTGLPFVVKSIWRFSLPSGTHVVIGTLTRQINQEATPLQEHTLVVAERPATDTTFAMTYSERSYGEEETIESRDVLAAALIGPGRIPSVFLTRDYGDAVAYGLIERGDDGRWHRRWTSARRHC